MGRTQSATGPLALRLLLAVLLIGVTGTLISWRLVTVNERAHIQRMTRLAASAVAADMRSDVEAWTLAQVRLAKMWEFGEPSYEQWTAFANLYLDHHPGCIAIEWLDPKYEERWISRLQGEKAPLAGNGALKSVLKSAQLSRQTTLSSLLASPSGRKQWFTVVPIYQKERFRG